MLPLIRLWTDDKEIMSWMNEVLDCLDEISSGLPYHIQENLSRLGEVHWGGMRTGSIPRNWPYDEGRWVISLSSEMEKPEGNLFELPLFTETGRSATAILAFLYGWQVGEYDREKTALKNSEEKLPTHREKMILQLMAAGESNKSMAYQLSISESTVKFHINSLMKKLRAQNRAQIVYEATRKGWLMI